MLLCFVVFGDVLPFGVSLIPGIVLLGFQLLGLRAFCGCVSFWFCRFAGFLFWFYMAYIWVLLCRIGNLVFWFFRCGFCC